MEKILKKSIFMINKKVKNGKKNIFFINNIKVLIIKFEINNKN